MARLTSVLAQELVRDVLSRSNSNSKCNASLDDRGNFDHVLHVADSPLRKCCIQIVHVADDFRVLGDPFRSDSGVGDVENQQERRHQDRVTHDVAVVHVPQVRQASVISVTRAAGRQLR